MTGLTLMASTQRESIARIEEQLSDGIVGAGTLLTALAGSSAVWILLGAQLMPKFDGKKFAYTKAGKAAYVKAKKKKETKRKKSTKRSY